MDTFNKQPSEKLDYDIQTDDWLTDDDEITGATSAVSPSGLTLHSTTVQPDGKTIKVWASAGTTGIKYKVTTTITTAQGRIKEHEFQIKVKEL